MISANQPNLVLSKTGPVFFAVTLVKKATQVLIDLR